MFISKLTIFIKSILKSNLSAQTNPEQKDENCAKIPFKIHQQSVTSHKSDKKLVIKKIYIFHRKNIEFQ